MRNRVHGLCLLLVLSSCFVLACLAYVELFRGMRHRVQDPGKAEFWQVRQMALQWRSPESEARAAFATGDFVACQLPDDVTFADVWIADKPDRPARPDGVMAGANSFLMLSGETPGLQSSLESYRNTAHEFTLRYNRELVRLMNEYR